MYEETKIKFDWKGFLIKFAILILVVILVIKLLPFKRNNKYSEVFNNNIIKFKNATNEYFNKENLPEESDNIIITLNDLISEGKISQLKDDNGKACDYNNSFAKANNNGEEVEIELFIKCGNEENTTYLYKTNCEKCNDIITTTTTKKKTSTTKKKTTTVKNNTTTKKESTTKKVITSIVTTEKMCYVVFNSNYGSSINSQYIKCGTIATKPNNPTKEGYTFIGWYYNDKEFDFNTPINDRAFIINAKWEKNN